MNEIRLDIEAPASPCDPNNLYDQNWRGLLYVDGSLVNEDLSIGYIDLAKSAVAAGEYYILTCGCGHPPCAGLDEPIKVAHCAGRICWHIKEPLPERRFEFSKEEYLSSILRALRKARADVPRPDDDLDFPFGYYGFRSHQLDWCIRTLETGAIVGDGYEDP